MAFIVTAIAAVGAAVGTAATVAAVAVVVTEVGLALTVVGAVTGDKDLMKLGGTLSLVGGVGGLAAGAAGGLAAEGIAEGAAGAVGSAAENTAAAAASDAGFGAIDLPSEALAGGASDLTGALATPVADSNIAAQPLGDLNSSLGQEASKSATNSIQAQQTPDVTSIQADSTAVQTPFDKALPGANLGPTGAPEIATPYSNPTDMRLANNTQTAALNPSQSTDTFFKSFQDFFNNNKTLVDAGGKILGGAFNGANQASMNAQKNALIQQQINNEKAKTALLSYGNQVGNFSPRGILGGAR